jgi:hypothetical protein
MTGSIRTAASGMLAGAAASAPLALSLGHPRSNVALGMAIGIAYAVSTRRTPQAYVDNLMLLTAGNQEGASVDGWTSDLTITRGG